MDQLPCDGVTLQTVFDDDENPLYVKICPAKFQRRIWLAWESELVLRYGNGVWCQPGFQNDPHAQLNHWRQNLVYGIIHELIHYLFDCMSPLDTIFSSYMWRSQDHAIWTCSLTPPSVIRSRPAHYTDNSTFRQQVQQLSLSVRGQHSAFGGLSRHQTRKDWDRKRAWSVEESKWWPSAHSAKGQWSKSPNSKAWAGTSYFG